MSTPRVSLRLVIAVLGVAVVLAGLGAGAYFVGRSGGEDLAAARAAGTSAGSKAGRQRGEHRGYATGFQRGRAYAFAGAYDDAFRHAYARAFWDIGVPPPLHLNVPNPRGAGSQVQLGD